MQINPQTRKGYSAKPDQILIQLNRLRNDPAKVDPTRIEEPGQNDPTRIDNPPPLIHKFFSSSSGGAGNF
ncbi:MAG: hypothetical protein IPP34_09560 [Bacteroidetes bacterium]|nr:hypothetical protein [Bacteroidota bacterium]